MRVALTQHNMWCFDVLQGQVPSDMGLLLGLSCAAYWTTLSGKTIHMTLSTLWFLHTPSTWSWRNKRWLLGSRNCFQILIREWMRGDLCLIHVIGYSGSDSTDLVLFSFDKTEVTACVCRYPQRLGKGLQRKLLPFTTPLPNSTRYCCTWRGGGFRDECKEFFESMIGKCYRVPGFLATSIDYRTAHKFIRRADKSHPRILWCILVRNTLLACWQLLRV